MTIQFSTTLRNARLNAISSTAGNDAVLKLFSGSAPANCAASDTGTLLAVLSCGSSGEGGFAASAASGILTVNAIDPDAAGNSNGTPTHFRLYTSGGTCVMQGSAGIAGTEDLVIDGAISTTKSVSVISWVITEPGA